MTSRFFSAFDVVNAEHEVADISEDARGAHFAVASKRRQLPCLTFIGREELANVLPDTDVKISEESSGIGDFRCHASNSLGLRRHRAGQRGSEEQRPGGSALWRVHRERRVAGPGRDGLQPHPRRGDHRRHRPDKGDHGYHPPETRPRPRRSVFSARRITLHLPQRWPWETAWAALFNHSTQHPRPAPG